MNTLQNLIDNGIEPYTAQEMLDGYSKRIGTMNGVYEITDITYDFNERGRDVTLKCSLCGKEIHRLMKTGRNKWSELIKSCPCEKERVQREYEERLKREKEEKQKMILGRVGQIFGDYKIISVESLEENPKYLLRCTECGSEMRVSANSFWQRAKFECREHKEPYVQPIKFDESYIGKRNNFLKVIGVTRTDKNRKMFVCECDCGNVKLIEPAMWEQGIVKSCGCKRTELLSEALKKENPVNEMRLYHVYGNMKARCYNPNSESYRNYGERGITICPEWLGKHGFENFSKWAYATGYDEKAEWGECTIERKDVNGNYCPENCEWKTIQEQQKKQKNKCFYNNRWRDKDTVRLD